ncbi:diphthine--ammonia ligase [Acidianus sp.]|jgi:Predicted ATPases of PP-loop superfamily|uniref:diphthine--ammonia ligase n=1 Tax=Acidianus sp. TaxID=1872104 RepID=UPI00397AAB82
MKVCVLYSGGKDSTYALHWAIFKGFEVISLLTLLPKREDSWMFQYPNVEFTKYQAEALGMNIIQMPTSGEKNNELEDLYVAFKKCKDLGAQGIVTGALLSDYQRLNANIIAEKLSLKTYSPLWRKDQEKYMYELIDEGFEFIITSTSAYGFPHELLGKVIRREDVDIIIRRAREYGFNPAFEGGEAETYVIYAPLFKRRLKVFGEIKRLGEDNWRFLIKRIL